MGKFSHHKLQASISGFFFPIRQVLRLLSQKYFSTFLFLIIPIIFLLNVTVIHYSLGAFFMGRVDPEYFYMYNGIVLGAGNLSIQYYAHPGTPLHFLIATSSRIIDLFQPGDYMKSFVDDPEKYIHAANLFLNALITIVLFVCGLYAKKYSGSYLAGLLIQFFPFGSSALLSISGRLFPEALMIIPLLLISLMIIKYIYDNTDPAGYFIDIVLYGLIIGFGIACKLTFIPVILIPLVLLQISFRQKIRMVLYTILFFAIFAYPVVFNYDDFWRWVYGIFTHSGKYGGGEKNFIDFATVPDNLENLLKFNKELFTVALSSLVISGLYSIKYVKDKSLSNLKIRRAVYAVNISILVCIAFTLKHFELYYFMPFSIFKYLLILLSTLLILSYRKISGSRLLKTITVSSVSVLILFMTYGQVLQMRTDISYSNQRNIKLQQEYNKVIPLVENDRPIIIAGPYFGAPFIEFAHFNGFIMCSHLKGFFTSYLKEKYPYSYQYVTWSDKFDFWSDFVDFRQILDRTKSSFYVYIGKEMGNELPVIENRIWQVLDKNSVTKKVLYLDADTEEQLIEITINPKTL
jgi:hypothetical protein